MYWFYLRFHGFTCQLFFYIPDFVIAVSSLYRAPALVIWGCVPVPGHVFTLITPPPLIISVVQSTASVQVYNALYTGCTAQVSAASEWAPTYTHSHQVPGRIYRKRLCIAKGLQSYFAGSSRPSSFLPIHCLLYIFSWIRSYYIWSLKTRYAGLRHFYSVYVYWMMTFRWQLFLSELF